MGSVATLTIDETAVVLRISRGKAYALAAEYRANGGKSGIPNVDFGDCYRVPVHLLEEAFGISLADFQLPPKVSKPKRTGPATVQPITADAPARTRRGRARPAAGDDQLGLFEGHDKAS